MVNQGKLTQQFQPMICADWTSINTENEIPQHQLSWHTSRPQWLIKTITNEQFRCRNTDLTSENPMRLIFSLIISFLLCFSFCVRKHAHFYWRAVVHYTTPSHWLLKLKHPQPLDCASQSWPTFHLSLKSHPLVSQAWQRAVVGGGGGLV